MLELGKAGEGWINRFTTLSHLDEGKSFSEAGFPETELLPSKNAFFTEKQPWQDPQPSGIPLPSPLPQGSLELAAKSSFMYYDPETLSKPFNQNPLFPTSKETSVIFNQSQKPEMELSERIRNDFLEPNENSLSVDNRKKNEVFEAPVPLFSRKNSNDRRHVIRWASPADSYEAFRKPFPSKLSLKKRSQEWIYGPSDRSSISSRDSMSVQRK